MFLVVVACFVGFGMLRSCSCGGLWASGMLVLLGRLFGCFGWFAVFLGWWV